MKVIAQGQNTHTMRYVHLAYGSGSPVLPWQGRAAFWTSDLTLLTLGLALAVLAFRRKVSRWSVIGGIFAVLLGVVTLCVLYF